MKDSNHDEVSPPWRDRGLLAGLPVLCLGLLLFVREIQNGTFSVFAALLVILGLGMPMAFWQQNEKFLGWRRYYSVLQFTLGFAVIGVGVYVSLKQ